MLLLLAMACGGGADTGDTDPDDTGGDTAADTDTDTGPVDTGIARLYWSTEIDVATDGSFVSAELGYVFEAPDASVVCAYLGAATATGPGPANCPDCDWSFALSAPAAATGTGPQCDDLAEPAAAPDDLPEAWGFSSHTFNAYGNPVYDVVSVAWEGVWYTLGFDYNYAGTVTASATAVHATKPIFDDGSYVYYYYYP